MPAKNTARKKTMARICEYGSCAKIDGRVMKISGGPLWGSMPKAKTAGRIVSATRMEAMSSKTATMTPEKTMSVSFFR